MLLGLLINRTGCHSNYDLTDIRMTVHGGYRPAPPLALQDLVKLLHNLMYSPEQRQVYMFCEEYM